MIYILGKSNTRYENEDLADIIITASTKIDDVLEYAYTTIPIHNLNDYEILVNENSGLMYEEIFLTNDSYEHLIKYPAPLFLKEENAEEFKIVCNQLRNWCDAIKEKKKRLREEAEQREKCRTEFEERELYEKLKAKYGD